MVTEFRIGWTQMPFNHNHAALSSSDTSYFQAASAVKKRNISISTVIDGVVLTKGGVTPGTDHDILAQESKEAVPFESHVQPRVDSYPPYPNKSQVASQELRQRKTFFSKQLVTITKSPAAKESRTVKFRKTVVWRLSQALKGLAWSCSTELWLLKGGWEYLSQTFYVFKEKFHDRKLQQLTLPDKISDANPGWNAQAHQLSYGFMQMKGCFTQLDQKALLQFPLKFAMEMTFADADEAQTVSSTLLISSKADWNKLGSFVDKLYKQVVFVRKQNPVSDKFTMDVAFAVVYQEQEAENTIYQRSNRYKNGTKFDEFTKSVSVQTCKKDKVGTPINSIPGIKLTKEWIIGPKYLVVKFWLLMPMAKLILITLPVTDK